MVPGFDLFLANALGRENSRAGGVWGAWRLGQIVVERFDRVLERGVVEEPREVLRVALRHFDGEAGNHTAGRACGRTHRRAAGRLDVRRGRSETDDVDVGEERLAD